MADADDAVEARDGRRARFDDRATLVGGPAGCEQLEADQSADVRIADVPKPPRYENGSPVTQPRDSPSILPGSKVHLMSVAGILGPIRAVSETTRPWTWSVGPRVRAKVRDTGCQRRRSAART